MNISSCLWPFITLSTVLISSQNYSAELSVYNNNDNGAGSLRQAVLNNNASGGGNTIVFSNIVTGVITLSSELVITSNVTILGPGEKVLRISGNNTTRVMLVSNAIVSLSGLMIANGFDTTAGGIYQPSGTLIINRCTIATNSSWTAGAINSGGTLVMSNSTVARNIITITGPTTICGVYSRGNTTLVNCTFFQNSGGINGTISGVGTLVVNSCTVYNNSTGINAGIGFGSGSLFVTNCTITANVSSQAAGIALFGATTIVRNSIIAGNTRFSGNGGDCSGTFISGGYNLIGKANESSGWTALGDQTGTTNSPLDPLLGPLKNNGGPTLTTAPLIGSPAIDQGHSGDSTTDQRGLPRPYDKPEVPNVLGGNGADIGALEASSTTLLVTNLNDNGPGSLRQAILDAVPVDSNTIAFSNVTGTILLLGVLPIDKDLTIAGPGSKTLSISGNLNNRIFEVLNGKVSISGLTLTDGRAVGASASAEQNGINERGGGIFNQGMLSLTDCVLTNCSVLGGAGGQTQDGSAGNGGRGLGGAIASIGTLALTRCTLSGNLASGGIGGEATGFGSPGSGGIGFGGGVYNEGLANITNCTISANQAIAGTGNGGEGTGAGGGIYSELNAVLMNSTIASNTATGSSFDFGGGIFENGTNFIVRSSTIAGNQATYGPGLYSVSMDLGNTILSDNNSTAGSGDGSGTVVSSDYNLISNNSNFTIKGLTTHNIIGQNALLGPLQDNGGPTFTMALRAGSPAIDRGKSFGITTDQRGRARPYDFVSVANVSGGDASDIGAFEVTPPILSIASLGGGNILLSWSTNDAGYTLESKTNLSPGFAWSLVPAAPSIVGSQFTVTNSAIGNGFFRLKQ